MNETELASWLCTALMRVGTRMAAGFDRHFAGMGVSQAQFRLLLAVDREGGQEGILPSVLADHLLIERPTVSVLATDLVERGLLVRLPGENRRTHRLRLTPEGEELLRQARPRAVALAGTLLAGIEPEKLRQVREVLETLESRLRSASEERASSLHALRRPAR